jgi:hypothetical protein
VRVAGSAALLGLSLGLGACGEPSYYSGSAFFANTTRQSVNVRLLELTAAVDCERIEGHACERLPSNAFVFEKNYAVAPGHALPLDYEEPSWEAQGPTSERACDASVVQIVGVPSTCVFWQNDGGTSTDQRASVGDPEFRRRSIRLEGTEGLYRLSVGAELESGPFVSLPANEPQRLLGFSGKSIASTVVVEDIKELPDGCLAVEHSLSTQRSTVYLCVPRWAFPFAVGSSVQIRNLVSGPGAETLVVTEVEGLRSMRLEMNGAPTPQMPWEALIPLDTGHITRCGAYVEILGLETPTGVLAAGDVADTTSNGVRTRVLLGRAERVVVAAAGCELERATLGTRYDLLTVDSLETDP